jgi:hypothetical protein
MSDAELDLRQQLLEARTAVQCQIDHLRLPPSSPGRSRFIDNSALISDLMATLREIDNSLADLVAIHDSQDA